MSGVTLEKAAPESTNTFEAASDTVEGAQVQLVKLTFGDSNTAQRVDPANPLPVTMIGAATSAAQAAGNGSLASIDGKVATAAAQATANAALASIDNKVADVATVAKQDALQTAFGARNDAAAASDAGVFSLVALIKRLLGKVAALGQATAASSHPVVIASDQSALPVTGPLTDQQLRNTAVPVAVNGPVEISNDSGDPIPVSSSALDAINADLGAPNDAVATDDSGTWSITALLKRGLSGLLTRDTAHSGTQRGWLMWTVRRDADTPIQVTDGSLSPLQTDEGGRLKTSVYPASQALVSGSISASGQAVAIDVNRVGSLNIGMTATALVGHNAAFEYSLNSTDGVNGTWYAVQAVRSNANTIETSTGVLAATPAYGWEISCNGYAWLRIRATAHTSGSALYVLKPAPFATEAIPAAQVSPTQPVSLAALPALVASTARAGFVAAAGIWFDDSSTVLAANATFTGTSRDLAVTASATAFANAATYAKEFRVSAESDQPGTLWLEVSRDNAAWRRVKSVPTAAISGGGQYAEIIHSPSWRYSRVGFTNGATLQTRFSIGSFALAA
jgi:hypothetical protein